jgi:hypothetical protein
MKFSDTSNAIIAEEKITNYLLSHEHPTGRFKAQFFNTLDFEQANWKLLERALRDLLIEEAELLETTEWGEKYAIRSEIQGPNGKSARIVSIWIILLTDKHPRFVTAYPRN